MELKTLPISTTLPQTYWQVKASHHSEKTPWILMLHGYSDSASSMLKRFGIASQGFAYDVLAPNGLFPVPVQTKDGFKEAYSWYFLTAADNSAETFGHVAVQAMDDLITHLNLKNRDVIMVGFSQGGFFAPRLAKVLPRLRRVIGVGCRFPDSLYEGWDARIPVDGIHGAKDEVIPMQKAQEDHAALRARGIPGEFFVLPQLRHRVSPDVLQRIEGLVRE